MALIGVSYSESGPKPRDWNLTKGRIKNTFPHNVKYYLTTYGEDPFELRRMKKHYGSGVNVLNMATSTQRQTYVKALELIPDNEIDFLICTRWDIHFFKKFSEMNIDFEKFNFMFPELGTWKDYRFVTDSFFAFPIKYKQAFIHAIQRLDELDYPKQFMHHVFKELQGSVDYHFISETEELSNHNSFYKVVRKG